MEKARIYLLLFISLMGCEEQYDWDFHLKEPALLVVEGMITNEKAAHQVKLSTPVKELNARANPVSEAVVAIHDGQKFMFLNEDPPGSGIYKTDSIRGLFDRLYTLYILSDGNEYFASTAMVPVTPPGPLEYSAVKDSAGFYMLNLENTEDPSMVEYYLDWSHLPRYAGINPENCKAYIIHYSLNTIDVNEMFKPEKESVIFPEGTKIYRKKYSMNEEHQAFVRTLLSETEWRGGIFDVQPGNVKTNLSEGATGYFSASTVVSDSTVILPMK